MAGKKFNTERLTQVMSRQNILLLSRLIEAGLLTDKNSIDDNGQGEGCNSTMMEGNGYDEVLAMIIAHGRYHGYIEKILKG